MIFCSDHNLNVIPFVLLSTSLFAFSCRTDSCSPTILRLANLLYLHSAFHLCNSRCQHSCSFILSEVILLIFVVTLCTAIYPMHVNILDPLASLSTESS